MVPLRTAALVVIVAAWGVACDGAPGTPSAADRALARRLTGVWDVELRLEGTPLATRLDTMTIATTRVHGAMTLLALTHGAPSGGEWLPRRVTLTGVYDLAFTRFGFELPHGGAVAGLNATTAAPDSFIAVLPNADGDHVVLLRMTLVGDSARGTWEYAGRSAPSWHGSVRLRRTSGSAAASTRTVPRSP